MAQIILDSNNNLIQGDFDNATLNNRTKLQTTTTNATTNVYVVPNGSSTSAGVSVANNSSLTNASKIVMATNGTTDTQIISGVNGSGSYLPLSFYTNNALAGQFDTSGNLLLGTSTAGGKITVLQSSNGVALNVGTENNIDYGYYGAIQITRPADATGNAFHLAFVRNGNKIAGMGFLDNSNTFAIQNANDNSGAGVTLTNGATSWGTTSDERKKDIVGNVEDALSKISDWRSVYYKYKSDEKDAQQRVGLIAQDVQKTLPEVISIETDELQTLQLRYTEVIPVLVKAIQELTERVKALESK
jgi:hypothetical protein